MAKDRNTPALFEVFGRASSTPAHPVEVAPTFTPPRVHVESIAPETAPAPAGPSSPRIIRLPIGYIYVASAVVVVAIVGSYFVGVSRGHQQALQPVEDVGNQLPISDPTLNPSNGANATLGSNPPVESRNVSPDPASGNNASPAANPGTTAPGRRTLDRDTRQAGLNYIIIERFEPDEAWAVKEFLKRNGIDVLVLKDNNPALLQVVTAEGFRGWSSNSAAQALDQRLEQLGRQWRSRERGSKDFSLKLAQLQK